MNTTTSKKEYILLMLMAGLLFTWTFTIVLRLANMPGSDYQLHMEQAADFWHLFPDHISYPLWHFLVYAVYRLGWYLLGNMPLMYSCAFVTSIVQVSVYMILQRILTKKLTLSRASLLAFALCVVMPLYIPWYNSNLYSGQISPNAWHNPTSLMVRPFALLVFFLLVDICQDIRDEKTVSLKRHILLASLIFASMLAKPSFFQGIVPALGIYIIVCLIVTRFRTWKKYLFLCLCFVPAACFMLFQFYYAFHTGQGEGIGFGWLQMFDSTSTNPVISSLLGIIFPVLYILLNLKKCAKEVSVQISLLFSACGWLEYAVLYELGPRKYHHNFMWTVMLAYFILWVVTTGMFFRDVRGMDMKNKKTVVKNTVIFCFWILHLICGIYYVFYMMYTSAGM